MASKHWDRDEALAQIESCLFACEAGPLKKNEAWAWLKKALEIGPKYLPGQGVWFEVSASSPGGELRERRHFYVVGVLMGSNEHARFWRYMISNDPPRPWHEGKVAYANVREDDLAIDKVGGGDDD